MSKGLKIKVGIIVNAGHEYRKSNIQRVELLLVLFGSKTKSAHLVEHFLAKYIQEL